MVTPEWADFPEPTRLGCTSMLLQLSEDYNKDTLVRDLLTFDTNLLIFLRRIEEINIVVDQPGRESSEKRIWKTTDDGAERRVVDLHDGNDTLQYLIWAHNVRNLPAEEKRPNWSETSILLAFPVVEATRQPQLLFQNVYAFLPIRNYGFKVRSESQQIPLLPLIILTWFSFFFKATSS